MADDTLIEWRFPGEVGLVPDLSSWGIFLSYRREDAAPYARLLQRQLSERFPEAHVFMDLDSIEPGLDFAEVIRGAVESCAVLVALIGRQWSTLTDEKGCRRLDNPDDYVHFEIRAALDRGVRVIPVLVDGARPLQPPELPADLQKLARLNALELSYDRYDYDANRLLNAIQRLPLLTPTPDVTHQFPPTSNTKVSTGPGFWGRLAGIWRSFVSRWVLAGAGIVLLTVGAVLAIFLASRPDHVPISEPRPSGSTRPTPSQTVPEIGCIRGSITLIGSGFGPIASRAASVYMSHCKNAKVKVVYGNGVDSAYGVTLVEKAVSNHTAQAGSMIAMYDGVTALANGTTPAYSLKPDPVGVLIYSIVAHDGAIPGSSISLADLKQLYTSRGGLSGKVGVSLQAGSANRLALMGLLGGNPPIPGDCPAPSGYAVSRPGCQENSYATAFGFVNGTPNAIGYAAVDSEVDGHPTAGYPQDSPIYRNISVISINGFPPTPENVRHGYYPFVKVEHLYLPPHPTALVNSFVAYLAQYLKSYKSPDYTTCSNAPKSLVAECAAHG